MKLRKLCDKDAPLMLEWIKAPDAVQNFRFDPDKMDMKSVLNFIQNSYSDTSRHYAVADDNDEYLGTISLKNIDYHDENAEYAISMRECARGTGAAMFATKELLRIAFEELGLKKVYLNVYEDNMRARRFYEKVGFAYEGCAVDHIKTVHGRKSLCYYGIFAEE
ncbi:MAG: GNAT family N-acetyltransferase [Clostridia bacterium]|nr:GNAT family N-acetyltransferase [Clostridia bacterium]